MGAGDIQLPVDLASACLQYDDIAEINLSTAPCVSFESVPWLQVHEGRPRPWTAL